MQTNLSDGDNVMTVDRDARVVTVVHKGTDPVEVPFENVVAYRAKPPEERAEFQEAAEFVKRKRR